MVESIFDGSWVTPLSQYSKIYIGYSGGLDSTALLHCLTLEPSLVEKIQAIHIHHGLSSYADEWEAHCKIFCDGLNIPFHVHHLQLQQKNNLEETARLARHEVFQSLISTDDCLLLAHHRDDQAETLLLNLLRGAGIDGLAAMKSTQEIGSIQVYRPLLSRSREQILSYAQQHRLTWVEDESNQNECFSRNFLRHRVIPLLQEVWPAASQNIARAAQHCHEAKINLDGLAQLDYPELKQLSNTLLIDALQGLSHERMSNVLRVWLKHNVNFMPSASTLNRVMHEVIASRPDAMSCVEMHDKVIRRYQNKLYCLSTSKPVPLTLTRDAFPKELHLPLSCQVDVRFRTGGETIRWKGQTKSLKKLFQQWQIPPWLRDIVPLIYVNGELASVVGYAISDGFLKENKGTLK